MLDIIKLFVIFLVMVLVLRLKKPLHMAIIAASLASIVLFQMPLDISLKAIFKGASSWSTIELLLVLYLVTFLQNILKRNGALKTAKSAIDSLFKNRRVTTSLAPMVLGMMPSIATVFICADFVKPNTDGYLTKAEQASVTSFFRHITEMFLPTYTTILVAINLTEGRVSVSRFVLLMIPLMLSLLLIGNFYYLRKIPKQVKGVKTRHPLKNIKNLFGSLWTILSIIILIIAFNFPVWLAVFIILLIYIFISRLSLREFKKICVDSFEIDLLLNMFLIMIFKEILNASNVIQELPAFFEHLPIPATVILFLLFFFGTIVSGSQAMVVLGIPIAVETIPQAASMTPIFILLMATSYAAMQLTPVHVCLPACTQYYKVNLGEMIKKTIPMILIFLLVSILYYLLLNFLNI